MHRQTSELTRWLGRCLGPTPVAVAAFLISNPAAAATTEAAQPSASDLFEQGKTLLRAGDWLGACEKFSQSHALMPSVSSLVKMARCSEHQGDLKKALLQYRDALQLNHQLTQSTSRQAELESTIVEELKNLEPRVPRLRLRIVPRPEGLRVVID